MHGEITILDVYCRLKVASDACQYHIDASYWY